MCLVLDGCHWKGEAMRRVGGKEVKDERCIDESSGSDCSDGTTEKLSRSHDDSRK